jgi:hypothetical protein
MATSMGTGGSGSLNTTIPSGQTPGNDYTIRIASTTYAQFADASDAPFTITGPPPTTITVTSPNGGETWQVGTQQTVRWTYTGAPGTSVSIALLKGGVVTSTLNSAASIGTGGSGSYTFTLSTSRTPGTTTRSVTSTTNTAYTDTSDAPHHAAPVAPSITVTSPNGGEVWRSPRHRPLTYAGNPEPR